MQQVVTERREVINGEQMGPRKVIQTTTRVAPSAYEDPPLKTYQTKKVIFRTYQLLYYLLGVVEILLGFRLFLKLVGANVASGFTNFIYATSAPFAIPFLGIVRTSVSGNSVMEWSTVVAMPVYIVVTWLIIEFFQLIKPVNQDEVEQTVDST